MGKSADTFGPIGPALVSIDAFANPNDLALTCDVAGERMQDARTSDMIFSVPQLVAFLSGLCTLEPGDLIFTGTPSGVGRRAIRAAICSPARRSSVPSKASARCAIAAWPPVRKRRPRRNEFANEVKVECMQTS